MVTIFSVVGRGSQGFVWCVMLSVWMVNSLTAQDCISDVPVFGSLNMTNTTSDAGSYTADFTDRRAVLGFPNAGEVQLFERSNNSTNDWVHLQTISQGMPGFGARVVVFGDQILIGSPTDSGGANPSGRVYIYNFSGPANEPAQLQQVLEGSGTVNRNNDRFGIGLDAARDQMLIGAPYTSSEGVVGLVYYYEFNGATWAPYNFAQSGMARNGDLYGEKILLEQETALIGSADGIFRLVDSGVWTSQQFLNYPGASFGMGPNWFMVSTPSGLEIWNNVLNAGSQWLLFDSIAGQAGTSFANQEIEVGSNFAVLKQNPVIVLRQPLGMGETWTYDRQINIDGAGTSFSGIHLAEQIDDENYNVYNVGLPSPELLPISDQILRVNQVITPIPILACPISSVNDVTVSPPLPLGLNLNISAREIQGAPLVVQASTDYTVDVSIGSTNLQTTFSIQVANESTLFGGSITNGQFGYAVDVSEASAIASSLEGGGNSASGRVAYFERVGNSWTEVMSVTNPTASVNGIFGTSVGLNKDLAVVGGLLDASGAGVTAVYERPGGTTNWIYQSALTVGDSSGMAYAFGAEHIFVGVAGQGAVYAYRRDGVNTSLWSEVNTLSVTAADEFGSSLAVEGDLLAVGAPLSTGSGSANGAVFIYRQAAPGSDSWNQIQMLEVAASPDEDDFGISVDLKDGLLIVGSTENASSPNRLNQVYLYEATGPDNAPFDLLKILTREIGDQSQGFGRNVQIEEGYAVVSVEASAAPFDPGRAILYSRHLYGEEAWTPLTTFRGTPSEPGNGFGFSMGLDASHVMVGAPGQDAVHGLDANEGAVYFYEQEASPAYFMYAESTSTYSVGTIIDTNFVVQTATGLSVSNFFALGGLPDGLELDPVTGAISGAPGLASSSTDYLIVGRAGSFFQTNRVNITVSGVGLDYGDAPQDPPSGFSSGYPTTFAVDGARHRVVGPQLGFLRDSEADGQPDSEAIGDDRNELDDEDGVAFDSIMVAVIGATTVSSVDINLRAPDAVSNKLDAWVDFNHNGAFDPSEKIIDDFLLVRAQGVQSVDFTLPAADDPDLVEGETFARVRLSTIGGLLPTGEAPNGEVEDHRVIISSGPLARDDVALRTTERELRIPLDDILGNDLAAQGGDLFVSSVSQPESGQASASNGLRDIRYFANADFYQSDRFDYTITEVGGGMASGTIFIEVTPFIEELNRTGTNEYTALFSGEPFQTYEVQFTENLGNTSWSVLGEYFSDNAGSIQFIHTNTMDRIYYRFQLVTP